MPSIHSVARQQHLKQERKVLVTSCQEVTQSLF